MVLKKLTLKNLKELERNYSRDRYISNPFYVLFCGYYDKNYKSIFLRDELYSNEFPFLALPKDKKEHNHAILGFVSEKELAILKKEPIKIKSCFEIESEFYYSTKTLLNLEGSQFSQFRKLLRYFKKKYRYRLLHNYPKDKILQFIGDWAENQKVKTTMFNLGKAYAEFCVKVKDYFPHSKWIFIEINKKLAGYCCSIQLNNRLWAGIHCKVDYSYKGLSRFILYERAKQFSNVPFFTLGSGVDKGVKQFKESLNPIRKEKRYFIVTE